MGKVVKKVAGAVGGILGVKKKKKAAAPEEDAGPKITDLAASDRSEVARGRPRFAGGGSGGGLGSSGFRGRILGERLGG